jgi:hypothetical protein
MARIVFVVVLSLVAMGVGDARLAPSQAPVTGSRNPVLEWNQVLIDTLIATETPNSSSQRLAAIVHTAIFDAYNGVEGRFVPLHVPGPAPAGASGEAAVIAAACTTLTALFPAQADALRTRCAASLATLAAGGEGSNSRDVGPAWGTKVATAVLAWRRDDGFDGAHQPFTGGSAVGQWRPTAPAFRTMSALGLAFTAPFVAAETVPVQFPEPRRLTSASYTADFDAVKRLGARSTASRTADQTALAWFWDGNASVHWNQAANQIAHARRLSTSDSNRLLAVLNLAMADTASATWRAKRQFGDTSTQTTWRPATAIPLADSDVNPATVAEPEWVPLIDTPAHPEYPAGHPSLNGAAATVLLRHFEDAQDMVLATPGQPDRRYSSIAQARRDGNNARVWGGMHYPSTVAISDALGERIATFIDQRAMQPIR